MSFFTVAWEGGDVVLLDQRRLPLEETYVRCRTAADVAEAIRSMAIRGAPAIGVAAAMGAALAARGCVAEQDAAAPFPLAAFEDACDALRATRPTAVNLSWALERMRALAARLAEAQRPAREVAVALEAESQAILDDDVARCRAIGRHGEAVVPADATILTHCNAGALATAGYGTALGVVRAAHAAGKVKLVLADETRPFLQGARLTAWELHAEDIPVTLITDSMAGAILARGEVSVVVVGADRIAANGDTANKIGTYPLAVLAARHRVPFYVAAPLSTVDLATPAGAHIPIEERSPEEVVTIDGRRIAPVGVSARHVAFDVTPADLLTGIITEVGVLRPPYARALAGAAGAGAATAAAARR